MSKPEAGKGLHFSNTNTTDLPAGKSLFKSKYGMENVVIAEQRPDGILLRGTNPSKANLEQTFAEMAATQEQWDEVEGVSADGLDKLAWPISRKLGGPQRHLNHDPHSRALGSGAGVKSARRWGQVLPFAPDFSIMDKKQDLTPPT